MKYIKRLNNTEELYTASGISREQIAEIPVFDMESTSVNDLIQHIESLPIIPSGTYTLSNNKINCSLASVTVNGAHPPIWFGVVISKSIVADLRAEDISNSQAFYAIEALIDMPNVIPGKPITPLDFYADDCVILIAGFNAFPQLPA